MDAFPHGRPKVFSTCTFPRMQRVTSESKSGPSLAHEEHRPHQPSTDHQHPAQGSDRSQDGTQRMPCVESGQRHQGHDAARKQHRARRHSAKRPPACFRRCPSRRPQQTCPHDKEVLTRGRPRLQSVRRKHFSQGVRAQRAGRCARGEKQRTTRMQPGSRWPLKLSHASRFRPCWSVWFGTIHPTANRSHPRQTGLQFLPQSTPR